MISGVIINEETVEIQWQKPYSFLMKPAFLSLKQGIENKKDESKSSNSSYSAPKLGQISNDLQEAIEETLFEVRLWLLAA